ncbi:MAG: hypothetical protein ABIY55_20970, partial [Kofleriaceae bacterium]
MSHRSGFQAAAVVALIAMLVAPPLQAAEPQASPTPDVIDASVRETIARYHLPGIAVGVIEDGKVVYARGYGETIVGSG